MTQPPINYQKIHQNAHTATCITEDDRLYASEDDTQITIFPTKNKVCLTLQDAYALGMWLIAAASRIQARYPESAEIL